MRCGIWLIDIHIFNDLVYQYFRSNVIFSDQFFFLPGELFPLQFKTVTF